MVTIRIAIVDDFKQFRKELKFLLKGIPIVKVVLETGNKSELSDLIENKLPDVILLNVSTRSSFGIEVSEPLIRCFPQIPIVVLTEALGNANYAELLNSGVKGFLSRNSSKIELLMAILTVKEGSLYHSSELLPGNNGKYNEKTISLEENLTAREVEIVKLICKEYTNREIADMLFLSIRTIDCHRERILQKTNSKNTVGIVKYAIKYRLLD